MAAAEPIKVCVTGAAGQIAYALLFRICSGEMFGLKQRVALTLLDIEPAMRALDGVIMEIEDCAFDLVASIVKTSDVTVAFTDVEVVLFVGALPRKEGQERSDLLLANAGIFRDQGRILDRVASRSVKCLVIGNPCNTNAYILARAAPSLPRSAFAALTALDLNRLRWQVARKSHVPPSAVRNVIIWGNHSASGMVPDVSTAAYIEAHHGKARAAVTWDESLAGVVRARGAAVIAARKLSSAASAAKAITDAMRVWWSGTAPGELASFAIVSDGSYGVPADLVFSFPVTIAAGQFSIVHGLKLSAAVKSGIAGAVAELQDEARLATAIKSKL